MIEIARARELVGSQPLTLSHPDPQVSRRLPYHFAKARGVIAVRQVGAAIELWVREDSESSALAEARRILRQRCGRWYSIKNASNNRWRRSTRAKIMRRSN